MFPNPQDALPLPARPSLEHYKKLAKELLRIAKSGDQPALSEWSRQWVESLVRLSGLTIPPGMPVRVERWAAQVAEYAQRKLMSAKGERCVLADAQFVLSRAHGFESWTALARHIDQLKHAFSTTSAFETCADAIVNGDVDLLLTHVLADPELVRARSPREHNATLLHYVAANGVEGWRQKTPPNIVEVAEALLDNGAEIDATAEMYGGDCTTLGLAATSLHPERAGVQIALLQLLLDRGARRDLDNSAGNGQSLVKACLANGRCGAAAFLASRGAPLDLEDAIAVGDVEAILRQTGDQDVRALLQRGDERARQIAHGFGWACMCGRMRAIELLLELGYEPATPGQDGQTGLHMAVIGAQLNVVRLLLRHRAPLEAKNVYGGTVLGQALWCVQNHDSAQKFVPVLDELLAAGAIVEPEWEAELVRVLGRGLSRSS